MQGLRGKTDCTTGRQARVSVARLPVSAERARGQGDGSCGGGDITVDSWICVRSPDP